MVKKMIWLFCVGLLVLPQAVVWADTASPTPVYTPDMTVTNMVNQKMQSYSPREMFPNDFSLVVGLPDVLGVEFDKAPNPYFSVGMGVGSFLDGTSINAQFRGYLLPTELSPYLGAGLTYYYINSNCNVLAWHADAGLDYTFAHGWGISAGVTYVRFADNSVDPFDSPTNITDKVDAANAQLAMHFRF